MIKIESKEIIIVNVIDYVEILDGHISMKDRYASFPVKSYNINGDFLGMQNVEIMNEEYDAWVNDDYVETIVLSKLGMSKFVAPEPVEPEPVEPTPEPTPVENNSEPVVAEPNPGTSGTTSDPGVVNNSEPGVAEPNSGTSGNSPENI
jgi:hypothetical protein